MNNNHKPPQIVRTADEIQLVHDLFIQIASGDTPKITEVLNPLTLSTLSAISQYSCWILGHKNGKQFSDLLASTKEILAVFGYEISQEEEGKDA